MSDQGDALEQSLSAALAGAGARFRAPNRAMTEYDKQLRVVLVKKFDELDLRIDTQIKQALADLLALLPVIDAPTAVTAPTSVTVSAVDDDSAHVTIVQAGTVDAWEVFVRQYPLGSYPVSTAYVIDGGDTPEIDVVLAPSTQYQVGARAVVDGVRSVMIGSAPFTTTTPGVSVPRVVYLTLGILSAARSAALGATDGTRDLTFTTYIVVTGLGGPSGIKAVITDGLGGTILHEETVTLTYDAEGIYVPVSSTFIDSVATAMASEPDLWFELRHASDATKVLACPAGPATDPTALYVIGADWDDDEQVVRTLPYAFLMPEQAFDSPVSSGVVQDLIDDMVLPFDFPLASPHPFGNGDGSSGVIQSTRATLGGQPAWDSGTYYTPGTTFGRLLPWIAIHPFVGHDNLPAWIEIWDMDAQIFLTSQGYWRRLSGNHFGVGHYPFNDWQTALYGLGASSVAKNPADRAQFTAGRWAFKWENVTLNAAMHNGYGGGERILPANVLDIKCLHTSFWARLINPSAGCKLGGQAAIDLYNDPEQGRIAAGQMSRIKRLTATAQKFTFTWFKPNAAMHIDASRDGSQLQADQTWLAAHPPIGY